MFDFTITEITKAGDRFCSLLFFIVLVIYWKRCTNYPLKIAPKGSTLLFLLITTFAVTAWFQGDFFGYMSNVSSYYSGIEGFHLEKIYEYIIEFTGQNYLLFRIVVWGGALSCFVLTAKNYKLNLTMALFWMFLLFASVFSYARASLAMAVYFLGFSLLNTSNKNYKKLRMLIGIVIIISSFFFHKSMLVMILLTCFYTIPISKKTIWFILIAITSFGFVFDQYMDSFMQTLLNVKDIQLTEKVENLIDNSESRASVNATFFGWIMIVWEYIPFYLTFIIIAIQMLGKESKHFNPQIIGLFRVTFSIVIFATVILIFSNKSLTFFYRYLFMSFIPLSLLVVFMQSNGYLKLSSFKTILYVCGGYNICFFLMRIL